MKDPILKANDDWSKQEERNELIHERALSMTKNAMDCLEGVEVQDFLADLAEDESFCCTLAACWNRKLFETSGKIIYTQLENKIFKDCLKQVESEVNCP